MKSRTGRIFRLLAMAVTVLLVGSARAGDGTPGSAERGRYLVIVANCVGCHTASFRVLDGNVAEDSWFTGSPLGFRSQIGTTYAPNLRLFFQELSEEGWLNLVRTTTYRRPMPWWSLREMTDQDLLAVYRYVRGMGAKGDRAPTFLPPGQEPPQPYIDLPASPS